MANPTWKNVFGDTNAGTAALKNAGSVFNRAFDDFGKAAESYQALKVEEDTAERKAGTDPFLTRLSGAKSANEIAAITNEIAGLDKSSNVDFLGLSKAANTASNRLQTKSDADLTRDYLQSSRENNLNRASLANQQTQSAVNEDNRQRNIREFNAGIISSNTSAIKNIVDGTSSLDDTFAFLTSVNKQNVADNKLSPAEEAANFKQLRNSFGLTDDKIIDRALSSGKIKKDADGKIDQASLFNFTKKYLKSGEVTSGLQKLKTDTGIAKQEAAARNKAERQAKIDDKLQLMRGEFQAGFADPAKRVSLINSVIEDDTFDWFGTTEREDAFNALNNAFSKGLPVDSVLNTLGKFSKSSFQGNFDLTGFNKEIDKLSGAKALESNINQEAVLQRQLDKINNAL